MENLELESLLRSAGLRCSLHDIEVVPTNDPSAPSCSREINFTTIAENAMNYLNRNPVRALDYHARFQCSPLGLHPTPDGPDPIAVGDTDGRISWEFWNMREIIGLNEPTETELGLRRRMLGYVKEDHLAWCEVGAFEEGKIYAGETVTPGLWMSPWATGLIIASLCMEYDRTGHADALEQAGRMAHALTKLAAWDTGRAFHAGGHGPWINGKVLPIDWVERQVPFDGLHLLFYYASSGEQDILHYCEAMADGFLAEIQPNRGIAKIRPDGSHRGHAHLTMRAVWGVAWLGEITGNPRYLEFARRVYEFQRKRSYDTGWFSAAFWDKKVPRLSETCATADMISTAACLARAGFTEYWDHVERFVRNYIRNCQFFITPAYETLFRSLYPGRGTQVDQALHLLRDFEGGFCGSPGPNDLVNWLFGSGHMNVSGCCSPEGMRSIHTAWKNTVIEKPDRIDVNMSLPTTTPAATVTTGLPNAGRVTVTPHQSKDIYIRPPSWTVRKDVCAFVNGQSIPAEWCGNYIRFRRPAPGEECTITYPLITFQQRQVLSLYGGLAGCEDKESTGHVIAYGEFEAASFSDDAVVEGSEITFTWRGNEVIETNPKGPYLPLYTT